MTGTKKSVVVAVFFKAKLKNIWKGIKDEFEREYELVRNMGWF